MSVALEKNRSIELSRRTSPFYAQKQSYKPSETVRIEVDVSREYIDFQNSRLMIKFTPQNSTDALTDTWFASRCVKNLRVKTLGGQMIGNEIREYRAWAQLYLNYVSNSDANASHVDTMEGVAQRALTNGTSEQFAHKFISHILACPSYYPAHFHQGLIIEFELPSIAECCVEATSSGDVLPDDTSTFEIEYLADLVQVKKEIEQKHIDMMKAGNLFVDYMEVLTQQNSLGTTSGLTSFDLVGIDGRVKSAFSYWIKGTDRDGDDEGHFQTYARNGLTSYRYKLGSDYLNYEPIAVADNTRAEQSLELMKAFDKAHEGAKGSMSVGAVSRANALSTRFAVGVKSDAAQMDTDKTISSRIDKDRNNLRVELNFTSPTAAEIYTHCVLDKKISILSGSSVLSVRG